MKKTRVIITGVTGMVGEGVLHECLEHPAIEKVLLINRRPSGMQHEKIVEIVHKDFFDLMAIRSQLQGYDACFFCLGVTSVGKNEPEYYRQTYTLTMHVAETLSALNPGMCFCYVSGAGTDSSEKGRSMWARVKGKTENDLAKLPFRSEYNFRPGIIKPTKGLSNTHSFYKWFMWLFPIIRAFSSAGFVTMRELGQAMIKVGLEGYPKRNIEVKDIIALGK